MGRNVPSLSTDQVAALVELAEAGSLRAAAKSLNLTEQGVRNRLVALETRLGVELYHKRRGVRQGELLTAHGRKFLPRAGEFLSRAAELCELLGGEGSPKEIHVAASQYLTYYLLVDVLRRFHARHPDTRIKLSARTEQDIEAILVRDPTVVMGIAAPYDPPPELGYSPLFSLGWSVVTPLRHPLLSKKRVRMRDLADEPLILFERGSTGRRQIVEAFHRAGVSPRVEMEATNTQVVVRMVEAGLGVSVVPLMPGGSVTRGHRVGVRELGAQVEPIHSGILTRRGEKLPEAAERLIEFLKEAEELRG